jgi:hypothetical protein
LKDDIHEVFDKHGDFGPLGVEKHVLKKNKRDLLISITWLILILLPSVYYLLIFLWTGSLIFRIGFALSLLIGNLFKFLFLKRQSQFFNSIFSILVYYGTNWMISRSDSKNASKFGLKKEN